MITYGKVGLWLWKSLENSGKFSLSLFGHPDAVSSALYLIDIAFVCLYSGTVGLFRSLCHIVMFLCLVIHANFHFVFVTVKTLTLKTFIPPGL